MAVRQRNPAASRLSEEIDHHEAEGEGFDGESRPQVAAGFCVLARLSLQRAFPGRWKKWQGHMKQLLWAALFVLSLPSLAWALPGILSDTASNFLLIAVIVLILILAYFVILSKRR